jgi:hypothetical protein
MRERRGQMFCSKCRSEVHPLDVFPGNICLGCYEIAMENVPLEELGKSINDVFYKGKALNI